MQAAGHVLPVKPARPGRADPIQAAMRADEMHEKGDVDGYAVWRRVVQAVEELRF